MKHSVWAAQRGLSVTAWTNTGCLLRGSQGGQGRGEEGGITACFTCLAPFALAVCGLRFPGLGFAWSVSSGCFEFECYIWGFWIFFFFPPSTGRSRVLVTAPALPCPMRRFGTKWPSACCDSDSDSDCDCDSESKMQKAASGAARQLLTVDQARQTDR